MNLSVQSFSRRICYEANEWITQCEVIEPMKLFVWARRPLQITDFYQNSQYQEMQNIHFLLTFNLIGTNGQD